MRPRPALPFSSVPPTPPHLTSGLQMFQKHRLLLNCPIHLIPQERQSKTTPQPQQIPEPRGADAEECGQEGARKAIVKCIQQVAPAALGARGPTAGTCNLRGAASAGVPGSGPGSQLAPERTWPRPRLPTPAAARASSPPASGTPRAVGGAPPSSHHPAKQHPTLACPRMKSVSVVRDQENRDPE